MSVPILKRILLSSCLMLPFESQAQSELIPSLTLQEVMLSHSSPLLEESGLITIFSPSISYLNNLVSSELNISYTFTAEMIDGLNRENTEDHNLSLLYRMSHIPDHWVTQLTGNIHQATISQDGIQSLVPALHTANTQELRIFGINTLINGQLGQLVNISTQLIADYADYEDLDYSQSYGINLAIDNQLSRKKIYWNAGFTNRQSTSADSSESISTLDVGLNYQLNYQNRMYLTAQGVDTSNDELNEVAILMGLNWQPNANTDIDLAVGTRSEDMTYAVNASISRRNLELEVSYSEDVTSARTEVLEQQSSSPELVSTYQSLEIAPIFQKEAQISLTYAGRRSDITLAFILQHQNQPNVTEYEETTDAVHLTYRRQLSNNSSLSTGYREQHTQASEVNDIRLLTLIFDRQMSKAIHFQASFNSTEQTSNVANNEYREKMIGFTIVVRL